MARRSVPSSCRVSVLQSVGLNQSTISSAGGTAVPPRLKFCTVESHTGMARESYLTKIVVYYMEPPVLC